MSEEIVNRVANSSLEIIDLEILFPSENIHSIDMRDWLEEGLLLREKTFRQRLAQHSWDTFRGGFVHLFCSTDAVLPSWAYLLMATHLMPFVQKVIKGTREDMIHHIYLNDILPHIDYQKLEGKSVLIKGCSRKKIPESIYIELLSRIQPLARSIVFGEACSAVPIYKNNNLINVSSTNCKCL